MSNTNIAHRAPPSTPRTTIRRVPLRREDAARYVRDLYGQACAGKTLARLASVGGGPAFRKAGKFPLYHPNDLDKWARARLSKKISRASESKVSVKTVKNSTRTTPPRPRLSAKANAENTSRR